MKVQIYFMGKTVNQILLDEQENTNMCIHYGIVHKIWAESDKPEAEIYFKL